MKKAFTLIELVIAITITAILASIGTEIISTVYQNYIQTRSITKLEAQTELAITQISKRLQYRIKQTLVGYEKNKNEYKDITDCKEDCGIAWYMQSYESRRLGEVNKIGWSGVINKATIVGNEINLSLGYDDDDNVQNLEKVKDIIKNITSNEVSKENPIALIFKQSEDKASENYYNGNTNKVYKAYFSGNNIIIDIDKKNKNKGDKLEDLYYLSHTINRIYIDGDKNLKLDVIPAASPSTKANKNNSYIIAKNVTTLRFTNFASENNFVGSNGLILKICIKDPNLKVGKKDNDPHLEVCKVKAII
ncbi:PulJ/GspJ family protein [Campylobacter hyointestinalis]|uniref:PulJ/GspJ family protein n=1 Tax=Campylobacter hyointestinalis TaxID=198 RepID=UPI00255382D1|nr:prepilin-type N-terminal cleavage/methylation domain-containing protein [Campylobacter hyointestinalis]MDL2346578.1 prepilin-type N-terminal cleavage/methylation domain-containing protein [Campylobacter hyointestinalis]MDL2348811.1 prepilin-type N-terminal cleavage/methylation domain-containing protein [Campylobacter hyointestinalis]MDL2350063.1 prepilin-type N-terminal cleavage/methylation domain-containing protein [Campylobacter hyointestinalis]MDM1026388.1 prepilin-type N-terminal cleavag